MTSYSQEDPSFVASQHGLTSRRDEATSRCRICTGDTFVVLDLGHHPFANELVDTTFETISVYALQLLVCRNCATGQLSYCADDSKLYSDYAYVTPDSTQLRQHYDEIARFLRERGYWLDSPDVLEIGSNVGRFLERLRPAARSVLGVDPAANISKLANQRGIPTINRFFDETLAQEIRILSGKKDHIFARHCFAHTAEPWHMLTGAETLLSEEGALVIENAYFLDTIKHREFDQVYHEHMYYYVVRSIMQMLRRTALQLVDVFHSSVHGGTMVYVIKRRSSMHSPSQRVEKQLNLENEMHTAEYYEPFITSVDRNKTDLLDLIRRLRSAGQVVHAYGASAKATTLLNYYHLDKSVVPYVVDSTEIKHDKLLPVVDVRIISEDAARSNPPDYYLLTIWNYKDEIINKVRSWGNTTTKFILPHPRVEIIE